MSVLLIAGSPSTPSRSAALLDAVEQRLSLSLRGAAVERLRATDFGPMQVTDFGHQPPSNQPKQLLKS